VTGWRRWFALVGIIALLVAVYFLVPVRAVHRDDLVQLGLAVLALAVLAVMVLWQVQQQLIHADRTLDGLVVVLVVAVLGFALGFYIMEQQDPGQIAGLHTRLDSLYFTMTTMLTVGFGDIHAAGQAARALVVVQMIFNVVVIATGVTTLNSRLRARAAAAAETRRASLAEGTPEPRRRHERRTHRNPT
jgi:voltage-gated potassium channel